MLSYWVYILTNQRNGTLYVGVTNSLERRIAEHKQGLTPGFAQKHGCKTLVWFEEHGEILEAIAREKAIKRWHRAWKLQLIEGANPDWKDLAADWFDSNT